MINPLMTTRINSRIGKNLNNNFKTKIRMLEISKGKILIRSTLPLTWPLLIEVGPLLRRPTNFKTKHPIITTQTKRLRPSQSKTKTLEILIIIDLIKTHHFYIFLNLFKLRNKIFETYNNQQASYFWETKIRWGSLNQISNNVRKLPNKMKIR